MISVKICGITNLHDALTCIRHGVRALGFVFAESKRQVTAATVADISRHLPPFITKVGVFVNEDPLVIKEIMADCRLDLAQLHGEEEVAVAEFLEGRAIKAFKAGLDQPDLSWQGAPIRAVLIDTYAPGFSGGTGATFDWSLFDSFRAIGLPLILAGGLNPENIGKAIEATWPDAVDLSGGVEKAPGLKDPVKIMNLMGAINNVVSRKNEG